MITKADEARRARLTEEAIENDDPRGIASGKRLQKNPWKNHLNITMGISWVTILTKSSLNQLCLWPFGK